MKLTYVQRMRSDDILYNPQAVKLPRPTITNVQWISGTQYVSPADMDILSAYPLFLFLASDFFLTRDM